VAPLGGSIWVVAAGVNQRYAAEPRDTNVTKQNTTDKKEQLLELFAPRLRLAAFMRKMEATGAVLYERSGRSGTRSLGSITTTPPHLSRH
jgi:hypothetical protein